MLDRSVGVVLSALLVVLLLRVVGATVVVVD